MTNRKCPRCGSTSLDIRQSISADLVYHLDKKPKLPIKTEYVCTNCGMMLYSPE